MEINFETCNRENMIRLSETKLKGNDENFSFLFYSEMEELLLFFSKITKKWVEERSELE